MTLLSFSVSSQMLCQYASSATATSENSLGSLATYAIGAPNASFVGQCTAWSGYGLSWSPANWNVKANLTLSYDVPVYATNLTIFGDYDICWNKIILTNSQTSEQIEVFNGFENSCIATQILDGSFLADTIILETCGWSWSSTDAVELCGLDNTTQPSVCGNNFIEANETCDGTDLAAQTCQSFNFTYGPLSCAADCSAFDLFQCTNNICGNGIIDPAEQCDDNNTLNGDGCSATCEIESANNEPVLKPIGNQTVDENEVLTIDIGATDIDNDTLTYNTNADEILPSTFSFNSTNGLFLWTPTFIDAGEYNVKFNVTDGVLADEQTVTITVNNVNRAPILEAIGDKNVDENQNLNFVVNGLDPDKDVLVYSAANLPNGAIFVNQIFNWTPSLNDSGLYKITFNVSDGDLSDIEIITITVESSSFCGNGIIESGEQCDDGNVINGDSCSNQCQEEVAVVCDWQDCYSGAASVSIDDGFSSCQAKLNQNGFKGTYYLSYTDTFNQSDWNLWKDIYNKGHEIGSHTRSHLCGILDGTTLKTEIELNRNDILTNINMSREELSSFAWPCGVNNEEMKSIASEYFISTRGYHINVLEDKNPGDFMNLKNLNTPNFNTPEQSPPDYFDMADQAEAEGKWVNYVFHNECLDDGAIDYLATKDLWVAPIGTITEYIKERQDAQINSITKNNSEINFNLLSDLNSTLFNQDITLKLFVDPNSVHAIEVNGIKIPFVNDTNFTRFNVLPTGNDSIKITTNNVPPICGNNISEGFEQCDDGNVIDKDGCSASCTIESPTSLCQYASSATATSENSLGSLATYAIGPPDASLIGQCTAWSGYGLSWSPANWNVKANLTLSYDVPVYATNLTIFGDYDICWNKIILTNSQTSEQIEVFNGFENSCIATKILDGSFLADTIILETCGWSWSSIDAVELCGVSPV